MIAALFSDSPQQKFRGDLEDPTLLVHSEPIEAGFQAVSPTVIGSRWYGLKDLDERCMGTSRD